MTSQAAGTAITTITSARNEGSLKRIFEYLLLARHLPRTV